MNEIRRMAELADKALWAGQVPLRVCCEFPRLGQPQSAGDGGYTRLSM
jgi:hypothetical protein